MAQDGFALLKQVAAAHLGNAAVQEKLCAAVVNLAFNDDNQVRPPDGGNVVVMRVEALYVLGDSLMHCYVLL